MSENRQTLTAPSSTATHETDALGVRDVDKEGPGKKVDKTNIPSKKAQQSGREITDVDLLEAIKGLSISPILHKETSTFVPNAHVMFYTLAQMDDLMIMNRNWSSKEVRWSPLLSRIYVGILFYIQTFRAMRTAGIASSEVKQILRDIEAELDYSNIVVPGPIVPFLKALCVSHPPYEEYGFVTPTIPKDLGCTDATGHALRAPLCYLLPNLAGLYNAYAHTLREENGHGMSWDRNFSDPAGPAAAVAHNAANLQLQTASLAPGTVYPVTWNVRARDQFQRSPSQIHGIPAIAADAGALTLSDYIGISENPRWFGELVGLMNLYSQHWCASTPLSTISTLDGPIGQFIAVGADDYPDRVAHVTADASDRIHFYATIESARLDDVKPAGAYAALTQINWRPPTNFTVQDTPFGTVGTTLEGPWWNVTPARAHALRYSPTVGIPGAITDKYYLDKVAK